MKTSQRAIEYDFLESILRIALISILIVIAADLVFTRFFVLRSLVVNSIVLLAIVVSYVLYKRGHFKASVLLLGFLIISAMFYQSIEAEEITTSSMAVVMVVGFGFSILLKGNKPILLHGITLAGMIIVFGWLAMHPDRYGKPNASDIIVAGITYIMLYIVIAYSSWRLRQRYDEALEMLVRANRELVNKSKEIETQNEELTQSQENLFQLNNHLETLIMSRTQEIMRQNERLVRYAYTNAHHLRGPVARALGLIQLSRIDSGLDCTSIVEKMEAQIIEIDEVVKGINRELEA